jgi:hypothetical protein
MDWFQAITEAAYQAALKGHHGVWVRRSDRCCYEHIGGLLFRRGDGHEVRLTEAEFRKEMTPT